MSSDHNRQATGAKLPASNDTDLSPSDGKKETSDMEQLLPTTRYYQRLLHCLIVNAANHVRHDGKTSVSAESSLSTSSSSSSSTSSSSSSSSSATTSSNNSDTETDGDVTPWMLSYVLSPLDSSQSSSMTSPTSEVISEKYVSPDMTSALDVDIKSNDDVTPSVMDSL